MEILFYFKFPRALHAEMIQNEKYKFYFKQLVPNKLRIILEFVLSCYNIYYYQLGHNMFLIFTSLTFSFVMSKDIPIGRQEFHCLEFVLIFRQRLWRGERGEVVGMGEKGRGRNSIFNTFPSTHSSANYVKVFFRFFFMVVSRHSFCKNNDT